MGQGMERFMLAGHNLGLDLMRATEAAALAAGRWAGRGDKESGDKAAVDAMRAILNQVRMAGTIVIGEGEKDEAPMLANGEKVGTGWGDRIDIAVDPVDGTETVYNIEVAEDHSYVLDGIIVKGQAAINEAARLRAELFGEFAGRG